MSFAIPFSLRFPMSLEHNIVCALEARNSRASHCHKKRGSGRGGAQRNPGLGCKQQKSPARAKQNVSQYYLLAIIANIQTPACRA